MKVLLINGSPRKEGNTYTALTEVSKQLKDNGIESEIVWIGNGAIHGCIACFSCTTNGSCRCTFNDDICNEVIEKMESCDGIILGSPVYYGQPSGQLIAIQQRMLCAGNKNFAFKPAAVVCVCRRGGATASFQTLQMPFQMCNMPIATSQYWNIAYGRNPGESSLDAEGMQTMRTLANNMTWMLKTLSTERHPELEPRQSTGFIK